MKFQIIISKQDKAGLNIASELKKLNMPFSLEEKDSIYLEDIDKTPLTKEKQKN